MAARLHQLGPPVRVLALELTEPLPLLTGCGGFRALRCLVRREGRPLGWLTLEFPPPVVTPALLFGALAQQLPHAITSAVVAAELAPVRRPRPAALPPISVVVCTRDRAESLAHCLASLAALDYPRFEVIVVDNASRGAATRRVASAAGVQYVREERPGLDWARNRGIREARHAIIAFTDDDVRVDPGWLLGLAAAFADPETQLVTGLIAPAELTTAAQLAFEYAYGGMDKGVVPVRRVARSPADLGWLLGAHHLGAGANMAFRRAIFDQVGGFDTALDVGTPARGGGDLDMFYRVLASGAVARYAPEALVWHTHRRDFAALRRQLRDNGRSFGVYLMTRWNEATPDGRSGLGRFQVARYATGTWLRWMGGRVVRRFQKQEPLPLWLQAEEIWGMLTAPWAYTATRRSDARLRARTREPAPASRWDTGRR